MHLPDDARWVRRVCAIMYAVAQTYTQTHTRTPCTMPLPYHAHTHAESRARIKDVCEGTGSHFNDARVSNNRKKKYIHTHIHWETHIEPGKTAPEEPYKMAHICTLCAGC